MDTTGTRFGKTKNHILGMFGSHREGPSSLEVSKGITLRLAGGDENNLPNTEALKKVLSSDSLSLNDVKEKALQTYIKLLKENRVSSTSIDKKEVEDTLEGMKEDAVIQEILFTQIDKISEFLSDKAE